MTLDTIRLSNSYAGKWWRTSSSMLTLVSCTCSSNDEQIRKEVLFVHFNVLFEPTAEFCMNHYHYFQNAQQTDHDRV